MTRNPNIDRSDWDDDRCQAANREGKQCGLYPPTGMNVCHKHGGRSKQSKKKSKRIERQQNIQKAATRLGVPIDVDPKDGILNLIAQKAGEIQWYKMQINALSSDNDLVWGKAKHVSGHNSLGEVDESTYDASVNQWLKLKNEAEKDLARYAEIALKYDIDERKIELARESISQVEAIIRYVLADERLGIERKKISMVPELMREAVRSVVIDQR